MEREDKPHTELMILLVEDEEHDALAFRRAFEKSDVPARITWCVRAEEALERLESETAEFDLVVADHRLPGMTGLELCKEILSRMLPLPVVLLTGGGTEHLAVEAIRSGVHDYLIKDDAQGYLELLPVVLSQVVRQFQEQLACRRIERQLEAEIRRTQKLEAVAILAGGVAHNFNNSLSIISGNIELLQMDRNRSPAAVAGYIDPIISSVRRMSRLVNQLMAFARRGKYRPEVLSLNSFLQSTLPVIVPPGERGILIATDLQEILPPVEGDATQFQMVLAAVVANAVEATEGEGTIEISTREVVADQEPSGDGDTATGRFVRLTVRDNGRGMSQDTLEKIFDPFFTTKFQGRGLGMAAAYGVVKSHGGWITVESEPGRGTAVHINLPAKEGPPTPEPDRAEGPDRGVGTVLLVEDEEMVLNVTRAMIQRLGYTVIEVRKGMEAVEIVRERGDGIDLVLLDIGLPDLRGDRVSQLIRESKPDIRILVCSGYTEREVVQEMKVISDDFIQKPYTLSDLSGKMKKILSGEARREEP